MTPRICRFESDVRKAALEDRWPAGLPEHTVDCADCRETLLALEAMVTISARVAAAAPAIPSYRLVWLRAEHARAQRRLARRRGFDAAATVGLAIVVVSLLLLARGGAPGGEIGPILRAPLANALALFAGGVPAAVALGFLVILFVWVEDLRRHGA